MATINDACEDHPSSPRRSVIKALVGAPLLSALSLPARGEERPTLDASTEDMQVSFHQKHSNISPKLKV